MAGRPRTRAREAAAEAAAAGAIPDSGVVSPLPPDARAHHAHAHTRARVQGQPNPQLGAAPPPAPPAAGRHWQNPGPQLRAVLDAAQADQAAAFAAQLGQGVAVRLERTRPTWCAGWLEDLELETGSLGEVFGYIAQEHGGQTYRVSVLHPSGAPMASAQVRIAGPPREQGRPIDRRRWEAAMLGEQPSATAAAPRPERDRAPAPAIDAMGLLGMFLAEQKETRNAMVEAMREASRVSAERQTELLTTFGETLGRERGARSLTAQLGELREGISAVEELRGAVAEVDPDKTTGSVGDAFKHEIARSLARKVAGDFVDDGAAAKPNGKSAATTAAAGPSIPDAETAPRGQA